MKIGVLVWRLDYSGGTERQAIELAIKLQDLKHEVVVYTPFLDRKKCFPERIKRINNIKTLNMSGSNPSGILGKFKNYLEFLTINKKLSKLLDDDLDIINCHEYHTFQSALIYKKTKNKEVKTIGTLNDSPAMAGINKLEDGVFEFLVTKIKRLIWGTYIKKMDKILVLDYLNQNYMIKFFNKEASVVRSGLNLEDFLNENPRKKITDRLNILSVGSFCKWRRFEDTLRALKMLKDSQKLFHFSHIGTDKADKSYANKIYNLAEELKLSKNITFHGQVSDKEYLKIQANSDVLVFANHPQTWGLIIFESLASGLPVIATKTCGGAEILTDKKNILKVNEKDPTSIYRALNKIYHNEELIEKIRSNGITFVKNNITWEMYAKKMIEIFKMS